MHVCLIRLMNVSNSDACMPNSNEYMLNSNACMPDSSNESMSISNACMATSNASSMSNSNIENSTNVFIISVLITSIE